MNAELQETRIIEGQRMDIATFLSLPETDRLQELIGGHYTMTTPDIEHQQVLMELIVYLRTSHLPKGTLLPAPTGVKLDDEHFVVPDVLWISAENIHCKPDSEGRYFIGPPDWIAEILSKSTTRRDRITKFHVYEQAGVREYWLIDPKNRLIEVWNLQEGKFAFFGSYAPTDTFTAATLTLSIDVSRCFPPITPPTDK